MSNYCLNCHYNRRQKKSIPQSLVPVTPKIFLATVATHKYPLRKFSSAGRTTPNFRRHSKIIPPLHMSHEPNTTQTETRHPELRPATKKQYGQVNRSSYQSHFTTKRFDYNQCRVTSEPYFRNLPRRAYCRRSHRAGSKPPL